MSTPVNGLAKLLGTAELEEFCHRFRDRVQADMRMPFQDGLDRYVDALAAAVANVGRQTRAAMEAARQETMDATATDRDRLLGETVFAGAAADRLFELLNGDPLAGTHPLREALFAAFDGGIAAADEWPEAVRTGPADRWTARPEPIVRMRLAARLVHAATGLFRRPTTRLVPVRDLVRTYALAELPRRVEGALNDVARLHAMALAGIRTQLLVATAVLEARSDGDAGNGAPDEDAGDEIDAARRVQTMAQITAQRLRDAAERASAEWDRQAAEVGTAFERAVFSGIVAVDEARIEEVRQRTVARREALLDRWLHYERGLRVSTATEAAALSRIAATVYGAALAALALDEDVERLLRRTFSELSQWLGELADSAAAPGRDTLPRMRSQVAELFRRLSTAGDLLPAMRETAERMRAQLAEVPETLPEETRLSDAPVEDAPPTPRDLTLRRAPLASMFAAACESALPRFLDSAIESVQGELDALGSELRRLHQAVDFNITAALRPGDDGAASSRELVEGVLDRSAAQLTELKEHIAPLVAGIADALVERAQKEATDMQTAVVDREFVRMRSDFVEEEATRRVTTGMDAAASAAGSVGRVARRSWAAGRNVIDHSRAWARERLGVARIEREAMLETLDRSRLDDETGVQLPAIYRQLFAMDDVDDEWDELLVPREDELDIVRRAFTRWQRQHAASVAIFGEKGSGKTTLVRMARQQVFPSHRVVTALLDSTVHGPADLAQQLAALFELDEHDDLETLASAISGGQPVVAVLEDAHHLFERTLGGFDVVFDFLDLLSRTRQKVFWVLTMDGYAWEFLDRILGIGQHFAFQVNTTTLEAGKLERAIMARHEVSGYALRFEGEETLGQDTRGWRPFRRRRQQGRLSRREEARQAFFRELNDIAEGNIFQGMFHWLRAITTVEEYTLVLRPPHVMDMEFLEQMPLFDLHTIAAVVLHGGLSEEQHARVFQMNPARSALHLAALADANLLFRFDDEYKINKVLYRPLVRLLRRRNIL